MYITIDEGEVEVVLRGSRKEFRNLLEELSTWTPTGGWSPPVKHFFSQLRDAGGLRDASE